MSGSGSGPISYTTELIPLCVCRSLVGGLVGKDADHAQTFDSDVGCLARSFACGV